MVAQKKDPYGDLLMHKVQRRAKMWRDMGFDVYFKFTCAKCGSRQTFDTPNIIYLNGKCEECGHITKLNRWGFSVVVGVNQKW